MTGHLAIGWYGKLPSLGDFASRRLAPDFIEAWDGWLAGGIAGWRARDPDGWLADYLAGPSWRFVGLPGIVPPVATPAAGGGSAVVAGVLMPSVDRVGRYFPLTLAFGLPRLPRDASQTAGLLDLLTALDDLAVEALQDDWPAERLDAELATLGPTAPPWLCAPAGGEVAATSPSALRGGPAAMLAQAVRDGLAGSPPGRVWWIGGGGGEDRPTTVQHTDGLPTGDDFSALLGGRPRAASA